MFPSLGILHNYVKFNTHTIVTLEKSLGVGSFDGYIGHLLHCQTTFLASSDMFNLPFVVWTTTFTFLGCWALGALALIFRFQQDNHLIILNAVTHVETNTSLFYIRLGDVRTILPEVVHFQVPPFESLMV
jgi:hypothetical protein